MSFLNRWNGLGRPAPSVILCSVSGYNYSVNVNIGHRFRTQIIWYLPLWSLLEASSSGIISYMEMLTKVENGLPEDS